jgi:hypothetical protein
MGLLKELLDVDFVIAPKKVSKKHLEELDHLIAKLKSKKKSIYKNKMSKRKQAA